MRAHSFAVRPLAFLTVLLLGGLLGACASSGASSGSQTAAQTVGASEKLAGLVTQLVADVERTGKSLDALRGSFATEGILSRETVAKGDIQAIYKEYRKSLDALRSSGKKVESANQTLGKDLESFVATWEENMAQVQNVKLREASMKRRADAQDRYQTVSEAFAKTWEGFQAHQTDLGEIELALGSDLTPAGIKAVDGSLKDARAAGKAVQESLTRSARTLADFASTLRASVPPEPAPKK